MNTTLARYVVRSVRWQPMLVAIIVGASAVVGTRAVSRGWDPAALLFSVAAMATAAGSAMDDPSGELLASVRTPLWRRSARAATVVAVPGAATWTALAIPARGLPVIGELTLVGAALCGVGLAAGAAARRLRGPTCAGLAAAPTVALVAVVAVGLPEPWSLAPGQPGTARGWSVIGALAASVLIWGLLDPARRDR